MSLGCRQYTVAEDTLGEWRTFVAENACVLNLDLLDPDDLIFPRAATRVGPKYQVSALPVPGDDPPGKFATTLDGVKTKI